VPRAKPRPQPPSRGARLLEVYRSRTGRWLRALLVVSTAFLAISMVLRQARAAVDRLPGCRLDAARPVFLDLPPWVDEEMRARLEAPGLLEALRRTGRTPPPPLRLFDPGVERAVAEALARHPMIQSVAEVEARYPSEVRVRATLRAPIAAFRTRVPGLGAEPETHDVPVAGDGVVLPEAPYARFLSERRPVVVVGIRARYPGLARRWDDSDEQVREAIEAARVANRLNQELLLPHDVRIESVDVSRFPAARGRRMQGEVVFRLSDGRVVQWGRTERDLSSVTNEQRYDTKRDRLVDLLEEPARPGVELDVRRDPRALRE
jgi:hypothetical protein